MRIKHGENALNTEMLAVIKENSFYKNITEVFLLESIIITEALDSSDTIKYSTFDNNGKRHGKSYNSFELAVVGGLTTKFDGFNSQADNFFLRMINYKG